MGVSIQFHPVGFAGRNRVARGSDQFNTLFVYNWKIVGVNWTQVIFKYYNFFANSFAELFQAIGFNVSPILLDVILPIGISFYTFTTLCYTKYMYNRESKPVRSLLDF